MLANGAAATACATTIVMVLSPKTIDGKATCCCLRQSSVALWTLKLAHKRSVISVFISLGRYNIVCYFSHICDPGA